MGPITRLYELMRQTKPDILEVENIIKLIINSGYKEKLSKLYCPLFSSTQDPNFKEKTELINKLIELGARITEWDLYGQEESKSITVSYNNLDIPENLSKIITLLGENHCHIEHNYNNFSPMAYAVCRRKDDIVKLLLDNGVPPDTPEEGWQTALYWSLSIYPHSYMPVAEILIEAGANKFIENERDNKNLLHLVVSNCDDRDLHLVKIFIECINIHLVDCKGRTPIHISTGCCDHYIPSSQSTPNNQLPRKDCPNVEIIKTLLNDETCTPDLVNIKDSYGWTALETALYNKCYDIAEVLVKYGANLDNYVSKGTSIDNEIKGNFGYINQIIKDPSSCYR